NIQLQGEKEYLSVDKKLNRLTVYTGELAKAEKSVVILPEEARLESDKNLSLRSDPSFRKKAKLTFKNEIGKYLYEVDPAVVKAELLAELSRITKMAVFSKEKNVFLSSGNIINSPFFSHTFLVLAEEDFSEKGVIALLKKAEAGKVTLRFPVDPKEYWKLRTYYERRLSGRKKVSLFKFGIRPWWENR
ncbi:hypothetical protein HYX13_03260, partial [Candidatus Woesearchaeota archaeon]|nr:hypothetical protein [Candidatus Woesearchaeota archaeon]